ncbi:MAG: transcription antitermination factor NusB [Candidatus Omnitrophica bacterium]|nr:transcription antitermination factor NusB [Candidatus Omnitrophota bacterium]
MRKRTRSREFALQILYELDLSQEPIEEVLADFWLDRTDMTLSDQEKNAIEREKKDPDVRQYAEKLVTGTVGKLETIDKIIERFAENWEMKRMAYVDRNILRLAAYEILHEEEIPVKVAINEAVELAKRYGEADSSKFVNGILDRIAKTECRKS